MWSQHVLVFSTVAMGVGCSGSATQYRPLLQEYEHTVRTARDLDDGERLFAGETSLELSAVTAAVLARNPSLERARQSWREALAQYPQASSLDDPSLGVSVAPLSLFDPDAAVGVGAELRQPLPFPGKRYLRGQTALAQAEATRDEYRAAQQQLVLMAAQLYYDYFLLDRALEINDEHLALLGQYRDTIARYLETGRAGQDDALKVDVDLAELSKARVALEADRAVTIARLNALLQRRPAAALPAPPADLALPRPLAAADDFADDLADRALQGRPELAAVGARERAARAQIDLARREFYPDFRISGSYNRMWPMLSHQVMLGLSVDLPFARSRRTAAVDAAQARVARMRAERDALASDVVREVAVARRRVAEADDSARLYRDRVLPAAEQRVAAVRVGLDAGRTTFIEVIRAERELRAAQLSYHAAVADAHRRRAELTRALGSAAAEDTDIGLTQGEAR
jgi:outer membrane protein, heavy metal efflux system